MSGGSFDYAYHSAEDCTKILCEHFHETLEDIEKYLRAHGKHDAADEVLSYRKDLEMHARHLLKLGNRISLLLQATEWWASCDTSEETFDKQWHTFMFDNYGITI